MCLGFTFFASPPMFNSVLFELLLPENVKLIVLYTLIEQHLNIILHRGVLGVSL